jgi:hypothetical protein
MNNGHLVLCTGLFWTASEEHPYVTVSTAVLKCTHKDLADCFGTPSSTGNSWRNSVADCHTKFWFETWKETPPGRPGQKWISEKEDMKLWTALNCLRAGFIGGLTATGNPVKCICRSGWVSYAVKCPGDERSIPITCWRNNARNLGFKGTRLSVLYIAMDISNRPMQYWKVPAKDNYYTGYSSGNNQPVCMFSCSRYGFD